MTDFQEKVERYMQCDKRTLAEMLVLKEMENEKKSIEKLKEPTITDGTGAIEIAPHSPDNTDDHQWILNRWPKVGDWPPYIPFSPYAEPTIWYSATTTTTDADLKKLKL